MTIRAWAAPRAAATMESFAYDPAPLGDEEVEVAVEHCGLCHSDLSMIDDEWRRSRYPLVPGHEAVGRVVAAGAARATDRGRRPGRRGLVRVELHGLRGMPRRRPHLCARATETIVGRHGGFADARAPALVCGPRPCRRGSTSPAPVRCSAAASPCSARSSNSACARPTGSAVLGHRRPRPPRRCNSCAPGAARSPRSPPPLRRRQAVRELGAHEVVSLDDPAGLKRCARRFDFLLVTANASLPWNDLLATLAPRGRMHVVGAVLEPIPVPAFALIGGPEVGLGLPAGPSGHDRAHAGFLRPARHPADRGAIPPVAGQPGPRAPQVGQGALADRARQ